MSEYNRQIKIDTIDKLRKANVKEIDWHWEIIDSIEDQFARGYLTCVCRHLGESISEDTEGCRRTLINVCVDDIWNQ